MPYSNKSREIWKKQQRNNSRRPLNLLQRRPTENGNLHLPLRPLKMMKKMTSFRSVAMLIAILRGPKRERPKRHPHKSRKALRRGMKKLKVR
jgi:hypothetical protein